MEKSFYKPIQTTSTIEKVLKNINIQIWPFSQLLRRFLTGFLHIEIVFSTNNTNE